MTLPTEVTVNELATLLGLTARRVRGLAEEGIVKKAGRGRYDVASSVSAYVQKVAAKANDSTANRLQDARADAIERRLAREDAEIVTMEEALSTFDLIATVFVDVVARLPEKITGDAQERRRIKAICDPERDRLEKQLADARRALVEGTDA